MDSCDSSINTEVGRIYPISKKLPIHEAIEYCENNNQQLASLHDIKVISKVSQHINKCYEKLLKWGVGLYINKEEEIEGLYVKHLIKLYKCIVTSLVEFLI